MRSLFHIVRTRRYVLLLFVFTILSLAFLIKLISYNSEKRKISELELRHSNQVIQNIESIRSFVAETESIVQSYLLSGDHQWKKSLTGIHGRIFRVLDETAGLETDPMQQKKFALIKNALQQKIAFQQRIVNTDSIIPALKDEMAYFGLNRRLTNRVQSPLALATERQELLLGRRSKAGTDAAADARMLTISYAVFVYLFILYALWQLRNQVQPGPVMRMTEDEDENIRHISLHHPLPAQKQSGFRGVFHIDDGIKENSHSEETQAIVRILWSNRDKQEETDQLERLLAQQDLSLKREGEVAFAREEETLAIVAEQSVPGWKAAGLPEQLTMHFNHENGHFLGNAVNFGQTGPIFNHLPHGYQPSGNLPNRLYPSDYIPNLPVAKLPSQEQPGFRLSELVQSVLAPFSTEADEKNIRLLHTIDPAIPNFLPANPEHLHKILNGLLENALRFTYKGYVQLTISGLRITSEEAELAFSVADTGKGIDAEKMQDLLHGPGSQLASLASAKKLIESHHNQLMIHSTEEDGTVCCFTASFNL